MNPISHRSAPLQGLAMNIGWTIVLLILIGAQTVAASEDIETVRRSIVRIYAVAQTPDYSTPWEPGRSDSGWGSGFIISQKRILTNAHVVSNARFVSLEKEGDSRRYEARVKYIAHDCDLAMLEVVDADFFKGTTTLETGNVPLLDSTVTVLGYPIGGDRLSITRGIVSRIDYRVYSHSSVDSHLVVQIDAAINPGNSGGPVIQDGKMVGVAFQGYSGMVAQNVGYMIPTPVVDRFLADVADGRYDRYADLGIQFFPLINPAHRLALGLGSEDRGVMVSDVMQAGAAHGHLKVEDVLLAIDNHPIFSDGRVAMDNDRLQLNEIVERKFNGDTVSLDIQRQGRKMKVELTLNMPWPYLMHARQYDVLPRFLVYGGLVFQPLSSSFYNTLEKQSLTLRYFYAQFLENELYLSHPEVIVISKILPDAINAYQSQFVHAIVDQVNDIKIKTLADLARELEKPREFHVIRVVGDPQPLVLETDVVAAANDRINQRYGLTRTAYLEGGIVPEGWEPTKE
jgi:S1-C subfamily serine protease